MYLITFNSKNIKIISIKINVIFFMVIASLGNVGLPLLNNGFSNEFVLKTINSNFN